jgi:hypothetical protein
MKAQHFEGNPVSDQASRVCLLFDPKDGRVVHAHGVTVLQSVGAISDAELEERARGYAQHFGKKVADLQALHVPIDAIRNVGKLQVNSQGDGLMPSPPASRSRTGS